uniref:Uncharacterized protein n=1 Tax=Nannospalax galili TaxID=1026970 RepID=A0A8C6R5F6_NANGA
MLKDYLSVAQDALRTQKELYHVKEQRLALALDEYVRLNDAYKEKSSSRTSLFSGSSSSTKYDPDILKAEISTTRLRVRWFSLWFYEQMLRGCSTGEALAIIIPSSFSEGNCHHSLLGHLSPSFEVQCLGFPLLLTIVGFY